MLTAEIREAQAVDVPGDDETRDPARVVGVLALRIFGDMDLVRPIVGAMMFNPMTAELSADGALVLRLEDAAESAPASPRRSGRPAKRPPKKKPHPQTSAVRRAAGTKPVACPVQDCGIPGIRSKMNFCAEHAAVLSEEERLRLRQLQRANHAGAGAAADEEGK